MIHSRGLFIAKPVYFVLTTPQCEHGVTLVSAPVLVAYLSWVLGVSIRNPNFALVGEELC